MTQRRRGRAAKTIAAGLAASCVAVAAAGPALADTVRNNEWWLKSLHVTQAWLSTKGTGVTVAVLSTGVDTNQPDLAGSVLTGRDFTGSGRAAGGPFWGVNGTAVASLIAGHGHGTGHADGIIGVAPEAKILSVRVTLENNDPLLTNATTVAALPMSIARGIRYAVRHGAEVIDLPLDPAAVAADNAAAHGGTSAVTGGSPAERAAVTLALSKGVVLVAPAGDGGAGPNTINYPAAYPGVISVGAFNQTFAKAPFTSIRRYVTLTGPGNGVIAANGPTGYAKLKSTTAASAVVAGVAALIRAQFPTMTPAQVKSALTSSTAFHPAGGRRDGSGFGTVDAAAALGAAAKINASLSSSTASSAAPTPPAAPKVKVHSTSLWDALRYPVLGLAALLLIALIVLITVRTRQRRRLDKELAPLRAAAQAARSHSPNGADLAAAGVGAPSGVQFGPGGAAVDHLATSGRRTAGRAPFDDPDFVPPSFQSAAFGQPGLGGGGVGAGAGAGRNGGAGSFGAAGGPGGLGGAGGADGPGFGAGGPGVGATGTPPFGVTSAGLPMRGNAAADLPMRGSAASDIPMFGGAPGGSFPGGSFPGGDASADGGLTDGPAFGRSAAADPPAPQVRTLGSAHRLNAVRTPRTKGHPPWEPAEKPKSELPWMDAPARGAAAGRVIPPRPYPGAEPGTGGPSGSGGPGGPGRHSQPIADHGPGGAGFPVENGGGLGQRGAIDRGPFPELDPPPGIDLDSPAAQRPRYSWNPADTTESFPAVGPDDIPLA
jgi:Subtilase family